MKGLEKSAKMDGMALVGANLEGHRMWKQVVCEYATPMGTLNKKQLHHLQSMTVVRHMGVRIRDGLETVTLVYRRIVRGSSCLLLIRLCLCLCTWILCNLWR